MCRSWGIYHQKTSIAGDTQGAYTTWNKEQKFTKLWLRSQTYNTNMDNLWQQKHKRGGGKGMKVQRRMEIRCIQKKKDYCIYQISFFTNLKITTKNETIALKKRGNWEKRYGIPPNKNVEKYKGKEPMEAQSYQKTKDKMAIRNPHTSTSNLNVNELISPIKRQRVTYGIKK